MLTYVIKINIRFITKFVIIINIILDVKFIKVNFRNLTTKGVDVVTRFFVESAEFSSVEMKLAKLLRYV